ncbi:SDR family NAD(P)-dependent oxidoreductase [Streptomyces sp. NPDC055287]
MALTGPSADRCAGRSVVVTGATGGIGAATALRLAGLGWDVIGTARSQDKADALVVAAAGRGLGLRTVVLDVADTVSCREAMARVEEMTGGGVWVVVNNAGVPQAGSVEDVSDEQARHLLEVNLLGAMRICRLALPGMRRRGSGRIVNVSSGLGRVPWPMGGWYSASKHALSAMNSSSHPPGGVARPPGRARRCGAGGPVRCWDLLRQLGRRPRGRRGQHETPGICHDLPGAGVCTSLDRAAQRPVRGGVTRVVQPQPPPH